MSNVRIAPLIEQIWTIIDAQHEIRATVEAGAPQDQLRKLNQWEMEYDQELCNLCGILDEEFDYSIDSAINSDLCSATNIELFVYQSIYDFENESEEEKALTRTVSEHDLAAYNTAKRDEIGYRYVLDIKPTFNGVIVRSKSVKQVGDAPPVNYDDVVDLCDEIAIVLNTVYELEY